MKIYSLLIHRVCVCVAPKLSTRTRSKFHEKWRREQMNNSMSKIYSHVLAAMFRNVLQHSLRWAYTSRDEQFFKEFHPKFLLDFLRTTKMHNLWNSIAQTCSTVKNYENGSEIMADKDDLKKGELKRLASWKIILKLSVEAKKRKDDEESFKFRLKLIRFPLICFSLFLSPGERHVAWKCWTSQTPSANINERFYANVCLDVKQENDLWTDGVGGGEGFEYLFTNLLW